MAKVSKFRKETFIDDEFDGLESNSIVTYELPNSDELDKIFYELDRDSEYLDFDEMELDEFEEDEN